MRFFLFLFALALTLSAHNTFIDLYQKEGIQALEKAFDTALKDPSYWEKKLQNIDTRFGYFEGINSILACNKKNRSLKLYTKDANNSFQLNVEFFAYVGEKEGDKHKEGDLKTPIGVFKIVQRLDQVDSFYGPLAYVTSYPNTYDKTKGKNGSGIWIHGLPLHQDRNDYTKGCIAINNSNIKDIKSKINFTQTLIYINEENYTRVKKEDLVNLLSKLYKWREAWKYDNIQGYLDFYDKNFKRYDGMKIEKFRAYKQRVFAKGEAKSITFYNINIIPYPTEDKTNIYLISFHEKYRSTSYSFDGEKELYVQLRGNSFKILAEK